jgi:pyruvate dehydrogenase E2 component (dihydrolipoamide acetyltransferase)
LCADADADAIDQRRSPHAGATITDVLLMRCASALAAHPAVNAHYEPGEMAVTRFAGVSIGIAVATGKGLLVPVLRGAEALSLDEIAAQRSDLVARARSGKIALDEMHGATFTLSNLGPFGVTRFDAILSVPQVAILAVGAVIPRVALVDRVVVQQRVIELTLTCDHRAIDGATGAAFLRDVCSGVVAQKRL